MAAQVLNGHGDVSWTNSTGQNCRVTLNAVQSNSDCKLTITSSAGQYYSIEFTDHALYGKAVGYSGRDSQGHAFSPHAGMVGPGRDPTNISAVPVEFAMENGSNFTITDNNALHPKYNIIIIPEAG